MSGEAQPGDDDPGEATPDGSESSDSSSTKTVLGDHADESQLSSDFYARQGERIALPYLKGTDAESEEAERGDVAVSGKYDGPFALAGERKAGVIGFSVGYMAAEFGSWGLTTALVGAVLGELGLQTAKGRNLKKAGMTEKTRDAIRNEPLCALGGLIVGVLFVRGHHPDQLIEEFGSAFGVAMLALPV